MMMKKGAMIYEEDIDWICYDEELIACFETNLVWKTGTYENQDTVTDI